MSGLEDKQLDILQWFDSATNLLYDKRPGLYEVGDKCQALALSMVRALPLSPERSAGLRHLLQAKDCFIRAKISAMQED